MREVRTQMASSASETTNVTSVDDKETEEHQTSEALVERTDVATVAFTATDASEENLETAVCNSCVTLKAKVVALQKNVPVCVKKAASPSAEQKLVMLDDPCIDIGGDEESEPSSEIRTDEPPSQASFDPKAEESESIDIPTESGDEENESRNKIRSVFSADTSMCKNLHIANTNFKIPIGLTQDKNIFFYRWDPVSYSSIIVPKFIVFYSNLLALFSMVCFTCKADRPQVSMKKNGTAVSVQEECLHCCKSSSGVLNP